MKKLKTSIYNKLFLQAEEAKLRGMQKLASDVFNAIGPIADDELQEYPEEELRSDIKTEVWKMVTNILHHYGIENANVEVVDDVVDHVAELVISHLESSLGVDGQIGKLEPLVLGEKR